jgi:tetratricopeptide (TPR) repeat protein
MVLLAGAGSAPLLAQEAGVTARLEPATVRLGDTVELVIEIEPAGITGDVPEPVLPDLPAEVVGSSRESRVSLLGTDVSRRVVYRYRLRPTAAGRLRIDPIQVDVGGRVLETGPLELTVTGPGPDGLAGPESGGLPAYFATARVDRERVYVGQQVTLTFAFYHDPRSPLAESPDYDPPASPGFWRVEIDSAPRVRTERLGSRVYHVQRFRYALFPLRAGGLEVGPATVRILEPDPVQWWRPGRPRTLSTDPLRIVAEALPAGAPGSHDGAVGRFELEGALSGRTATVGVPLELSLEVEGIGNPTTVGEPLLPAWPDVTVTRAGTETTTRVRDGIVRGESSFRYLLSPAQPGPLDLGLARFAYFDPDRAAYVVDSLELGEIEVRPGMAPVAAAGPSDRQRPEDGPTLRPARRPVDDAPAAPPASYWGGLLAPWLAWLAVLAWRRRPRPRKGPLDALDRFAVQRSRAATEGGELESALRAMDDALVAFWPDGPPADVAALAREARAAVHEAAYGRAAPDRSLLRLSEVEERLRRASRSRVPKPVPGAALAAGALLLLAGQAAAQERASGDDPRVAWETANAAYRAGDFEVAATAYRDLAARHADPHLEADLAAALWKAGRRGEAVLHYRRALALAPRDEAVRADLARLRAGLAVPGEPGRMGLLERARLDEFLWTFFWTSALGFVVFVAGRGRRRIAVPVLAAIALVGTVTAVRAWREGHDLAVAIRPAEIAAAPGGAGIAPLPEGITVRVLERGGSAWRVRPPGGPAGWVSSVRLEPIDGIRDRRPPARPGDGL